MVETMDNPEQEKELRQNWVVVYHGFAWIL